MHVHGDIKKSCDAPGAFKVSPWLSVSPGVIFSAALFSSHQKLSIGWQVVSRQFQLGWLSTLFSQRISFLLIAPLFSSLLIDSTLKAWQLQKKERKTNHPLSQIRSCSAHDKVNWTMIYFIFASCHRCHWHAHPSFHITWFNTLKSHIQTDAHCTGSRFLLHPLTDWLIFFFFFFYKHLLRSAWIIKRLNRKYCTAGYE